MLDIFFGGNQYLIKPQFGRQDASKGWLLYGGVNETKKAVSLGIKGQIRDFKIREIGTKKYLFTSINNDNLQVYEIQ